MVGKTGRYKFNDSIFNLMKLFENGILLKNYVVIYAQILHQSFLQTIYENYHSVFLLSYSKRKFGDLYTGLI